MNRKITTLAFALTAAVGALAFSVESADARGGHGGFGRAGHGGGMMRHGGFGRHGGFHYRRHFGHRHWLTGGTAGATAATTPAASTIRGDA